MSSNLDLARILYGAADQLRKMVEPSLQFMLIEISQEAPPLLVGFFPTALEAFLFMAAMYAQDVNEVHLQVHGKLKYETPEEALQDEFFSTQWIGTLDSAHDVTRHVIPILR